MHIDIDIDVGFLTFILRLFFAVYVDRQPFALIVYLTLPLRWNPGEYMYPHILYISSN